MGHTPRTGLTVAVDWLFNDFEVYRYSALGGFMADQRYYSDEDRERGVTPEQLRELPPETQREYLIDWFERHYQDPVHETPYNGQEGGYLYIHGGPYEAHEELQNEFAGIVSDELIEEVADFIEGIDGITEWAPGPEHPDQIDRAAEALAERDDEPPSCRRGRHT